MTDAAVLLDRLPSGALQVTINRPEKLNAVDLPTSARLREVMAMAGDDDTIRTVILCGAGVAAFSAGYDIHEMADFDRKTIIASIVERDPLLWEIATHPKVVICAINGVAHGVGALIAAASDIRIGGPATNFRVTATRYGSANATWTLPAIVGMPMAKEILLTGRAVDAQECLRIGLLNHLVPEDQVIAKAIELAESVAANPPQGALSVKALLTASIGKGLEAQYHAEQVMMIAAPSRYRGGGIFEEFLAADGCGEQQDAAG